MTCPKCGQEKHSWADEKFGCRRDRLPSIKVRHGLRGACFDYREDLARTPDEIIAAGDKPARGGKDPQAFTSGPRDVQKLRDRRLREGWVDLGERKVGSAKPKPSQESLIEKAYERAKAQGFKSDD